LLDPEVMVARRGEEDAEDGVADGGCERRVFEFLHVAAGHEACIVLITAPKLSRLILYSHLQSTTCMYEV